jgi:hypothetical protein
MDHERLRSGLTAIRDRVFNRMFEASKNGERDLAEWLESVLVEIDATLKP